MHRLYWQDYEGWRVQRKNNHITLIISFWFYEKSRIQINSAIYIIYVYHNLWNIFCWKWFCFSIFAPWYIPLNSLFYQRCLSRIWYQCVKFDKCRSNKKIASKYCNVSWQQSSHQSCYKITRITFIEYIKYVCIQVSLVGWSCNVWFPVYIYAKMYFCFV